MTLICPRTQDINEQNSCKMKRYITRLYGVILILLTLQSTAQINKNYPEIGKSIPEDFKLQNIQYFPKKSVTMAEFKGKWLVLDFWTIHCASCIASFPSVNKEMKKFKDKVQFMLVGVAERGDNEAQIKSLYATITKRANLQLPCAFDSTLYYRYDLNKTPYVIMVDPTGIVRALTTEADESTLDRLMKGETLATEVIKSARRKNEQRMEIAFDSKKPFLINGNGGADTDYLFRSILKKCGPEYSAYDLKPRIELQKNGLYQTLRTDLIYLYKIAFWGQYQWSYIKGHYQNGKSDSLRSATIFPEAVLNVKDTTVFNNDFIGGTNAFCYSLQVPPAEASKQRMMKIMQNDLANYFGYDAHIEDREMPCLKLIISDNKKVKKWQLGDTSTVKVLDKSKLKKYIPNFSISQILLKIEDEIAWKTFKRHLPVVDFTELQCGINFIQDCYWSDYNDVRRCLKANGLDLVLGTKKMKVLVISDPKPKETAALGNN